MANQFILIERKTNAEQGLFKAEDNDCDSQYVTKEQNSN